MAWVVPAAPGTPRFVLPTAGPWAAAALAPPMLMPAPTTMVAFSSLVIAATTSFTGLFPSCGAPVWAATAPTDRNTRNTARISGDVFGVIAVLSGPPG